MVGPASSFRDFEHQGWSTEAIATAYHDRLSPLMTQAIEALLVATGVTPGAWVADVATGAGYAAAAALARGAEVVGIDFSSTQIALARQLYPDIEFREGDAGALPLPDDSFDAVISNFGMPHFPDPDAFLREAFRVLRSSGRVAFSAWASSQECIGFRSVTVTKIPQVWRVTAPDEPFEAILNGTVRAAALLRAQAPDALAAIRDAVRQAVTAYAHGGAFELPMPAVMAAAEKP
jgi:ubiquinone/menaquinone biosynthesis C-methylase UbiE